MNFIEKNTKKVALILCLATAGSAVTTVYAAQNAEGWHGTGTARVYKVNGEIKVNGWVFDELGTYYVNKDGNPVVSSWKEVNGARYYFDKEGKRVSGNVKIKGHDYVFQKNGKLLQGWSDKKTTYYNEYGIAVTGVQVIDGKTFNFSDKGLLQGGWVNVDNKDVYFNADGSLANGVVNIDGTDYNFQADGTITTGWKDIDGEKAYYDEKGFITMGFAEIDGNKYYFNKDGLAATDTEYAGYKFDADGVATEIVEEEETSAVSGSSKASGSSATLKSADGSIASSALGQVGIYQDCTALATNALAARGIYFHGWPADYMSLGSVTSSPQAGDLIYYANGGTGSAHIAVYVGNGQAVHGGWLGNQTVVSSAYVGSGPVFIRVN